MHYSRWIVGSVLAFLAFAWLFATTVVSLGNSLFRHWRLLFLHSETSVEFWVLVLIASACVAAVTALFRYEQQLISLKLGVGLLTLRVSLILVIFLTLLEPVWSWSYDLKQQRRVLIALDVSESMDTIDRQAAKAEKIRWAQAIGIFGSEDARKRADRWISALQAGEEPEWVSSDEVADFEKRKQLALVRKENLNSQLKEIDRLSRLEILRRAMIQQPESPLDQLQKQSTLQLSAIAETSAPIELEQLQSTANLQKLQVGRAHSNLSETVEAAKQDSSNTPLAGVILFSDGHDTDAANSGQLLNRLQGLGVPVHTVLVGSEHQPRDLSIVHIDQPESVFLKDRPQVKTILRTSGFEGDSIKVYLDYLDGPEQPPQEKTVTPTGPSAEVDFTLDEMPVGRHRFRIRMDVAPHETRDDNNSSDFSLNVVDDRARALLVDGESRWEFRFLDAALSRDQQISLDHVLFEQPFLHVLRKPFFPTSIDQITPEEEMQTTPFAAYDIVLIGDVSPQNMNAERWQQLDRYVREEGGTLVLTAGKRFFPFAYAGTLAESLLPVEDLRVMEVDDSLQMGPPRTRGFRLDITPDGEQLPMFQLDADPAKSRRIWSNLPGHLWGIVGTARGGASVWAAALNPGQKASLENERQNGVIVQHYVGTGQVIWMGIDSTWRWRYLVGDLYHHRFWGQLVRWAVSFKATAGNELVRLGLREAVIHSGQNAMIQARWDQRFLAQNPQLKAEAVIEQQGDGQGFTQTIPLVPRGGNSLIHEGKAAHLPPGEYSVRLRLSNAEIKMELPEVMLVVNAELTPELQDVSANRSLLEQIASSTNGQFLQLNDLYRLPELFEDTTQTEHVREEIPLYGHWLILLIFSGLAMTEWVFRKLNGLP